MAKRGLILESEGTLPRVGSLPRFRSARQFVRSALRFRQRSGERRRMEGPPGPSIPPPGGGGDGQSMATGAPIEPVAPAMGEGL